MGKPAETAKDYRMSFAVSVHCPTLAELGCEEPLAKQIILSLAREHKI